MRVEAFDALDIQKLRIGSRHSAAISSSGQLWMYGNGNWGILGQGNEANVRYDQPVKVNKFE